MAERLAYLEAVVGADITQFRKGMRDIRNETGLLSETMSGIAGIGRTLTFALTTPLVALGSFAVQEAAAFDGAMRNINSILGLSETEFNNLSMSAFEFAKTTREGVVPATEALYEVFSAGVLDQEKAMAIWETSTRVAEAGLADLSSTTNAITATMSAFNLSQEEATRVGNVWTRMVQAGVGSLDDFLSNSQKVLPLSSALKISLEDMGATLAFLSQGGGGAAKAETSYAMLLSNLIKPTEALTAAYQELGVTTGRELIDHFGSVGDAVMGLRDVMGEVDFYKAFSKTGLEAGIRIVENFDQMKKAAEEFNDGLDSATMDAWAEQAKSFSFQLDIMKTAVSGVSTVIGQALMPMLTPIVMEITKIANTISDANPDIIKMGVAFAAAAAALPPLLWLFGSLVTPIGLVLGAVAALGVAFSTNFGGIRDAVNGAISDITGDLSGITSIVDDVMATLFPPDAPDLPTAISNEITTYEPIELAASDFVTVKAGDTIWSIWAANYSDRFSWDEFKTEIGWTPHTLQIGEVIEVPGSFGTDLEEMIRHGFQGNSSTSGGLGASMEEIMRMNNATSGGSAIADAMSDRIVNAIEIVKARMPEQLQGLIDRAVTWFDTNAGSLLDNIATLFEPSAEGGDSPVYRSFTAVLEGDIGRAIDEIIPGLGTRVSAAIGGWNLADAFPQVTAALSNLLNRVGTWLLSDGIPIISRSVGYLAGRLGVEFTRAIESAMNFLTSPATGQAASDAASYAQTGIIDPFAEGFNDAIAGTTFQSALDTAKQSLTDAIASITDIAGLLQIDESLTSIGNLGDSIVGFIDKLTKADWSSVNKVIDFLMKLTLGILGFAWGLGNSIVSALVNSVADMLDAVGLALQNFIDFTALISSGDYGEAFTKLGGGLVNLAVGLLKIPINVIDSLTSFINDLTGWNLPSLAQSIEDAFTEVPKVDVTTVLDTSNLAQGYLVGADMGYAVTEGFKGGFDNIDPAQWLKDRMAEAAPEMLSMWEGTPVMEQMTIEVQDIVFQHPEWVNDPAKVFEAMGIENETGYVWTPAVQVDPVVTSDSPLMGSGQLMPEGLFGDTATPIAIDTLVDVTGVETFAADAAKKTFDAEAWRVEAEAAGTAGIDSLSTIIADSVANGQLDETTIIDGFITPLTTAWTTAFGAEGTMQTDFTNFMLSVLMNATAVGTSFVVMGVVALGAMTTLQKGLDPVITAIVQMLDNVVQTANDAAGAIQSVVDSFNANQAVLATPMLPAPAAAPPIAGARAEGGNVSGGSTYLVGEGGAELFTPHTSGSIMSNEALFGALRRNAQGSGGGNTINVYGVQDVDGFLYQLRRKNVAI